MVLAQGLVIRKSDVALDAPIRIDDASTNYGELTLAELEKRHILSMLDATEFNRTKAAEKLGISIRTLRNKLNEYREQGLEIPKGN